MSLIDIGMIFSFAYITPINLTDPPGENPFLAKIAIDTVVGVGADNLIQGEGFSLGKSVKANSVSSIGPGSNGFKKGKEFLSFVQKNNGKGNPCRIGKQSRLKEIANDDKASTALRGEIKHDINEIKLRKRKNLRVPQEYNLAHRRGYEAKKGYGYEYSDLQIIRSHRTQHKHDGYGKRTKQRR